MGWSSRGNQAPTLTLRPILGTATMATTERGLLMSLKRPLDPTLTPLLILGTATTAMEATEATMARGLLIRPPLPSLAPTLMLRLTPGTDTTATDIMVVLATVDTTGDKKWTSRTTSDLFLPTH